jgi:RNA polymerase sigma-70 factor, ECF subfamily
VDESDVDIYTKYADELTRFATGLIGPSDAEDVVVNAYLRCVASRRWPQVENRRSYLYRAVLNEARATQRASTRRHLRERVSARRESVAFDSPRLEVLDAVARLSLRQRSVIFLTYWSDLDPGTIGQLLSVSDGAVRRHLARARARLREELDDHE